MAKGKAEITVAVNILKRLEVELDDAGVLHIRLFDSNDATFTDKRVESFHEGDKVTLDFGKQ